MHEHTRLSNGLRVVSSTIPHARSVSITFFVSAGSRHEPTEIQGMSHFIEHMLFKGTERRPTPKDISLAIEGLGGYFNAEAGKEVTVYWDKVAKEYWKVGLEVLTDLLRHSLFVPEEIEKERRVIIEELGMLVDSPGEWVHILADEAMWGDEPLGRDVGGTRESVSTINREQMLEWMNRYYCPSNLVISVVGALHHREICDEVERHLGSWTGGVPTVWKTAQHGPVSRVKLKSKKTEQAHFCLAVPGLSYVSPDRFALELMNIVLGEGMSSRLFLEIRERLGLAYDVHSYNNQYRDTGSVVIYAGVDPKKIDEALRATLEIVGQLQHDLGDEELKHAKEFWKGRLELRLEDTRSIASWLGAQELLLDQIMTADQVIEQVEKVTVEDVRNLARSLFATDRLSLSVIGPYRDENRFLRHLRL